MNQQLENWLEKAELTYGPARAIIAPYVVALKIINFIFFISKENKYNVNELFLQRVFV